MMWSLLYGYSNYTMCTERTFNLFNRDSCLNKYTFLVMYFVSPSGGEDELQFASCIENRFVATLSYICRYIKLHL